VELFQNCPSPKANKMTRTYLDKNGLERDQEGKRIGFKCQIKLRKPMARESFKRWGIKQRIHIAKHPTVWVYYASSRAIGLPQGIPISIMKNNKVMVDYLIDTFLLGNGEVFALHGYCHKKTAYHCGLTKILARIEIYDAEKKLYKITQTGLLSRYWFRREERARRKRMWEG
jgi:hypothetical protein